MRKIVLSVVAACLLFAQSALAATITLTITRSGTPTIPATHWLVEERVNNVWGTPTGVTNSVLIPATQLTYEIPNRAPSSTYTFRVTPVANGLNGTPSNICTTVLPAPNETISITCGAH